MAAGIVIKHKRKSSAFVNGELAAGEMGLDTANGVWYFSADGANVFRLCKNINVSNTAPHSPQVGDLWVDTN